MALTKSTIVRPIGSRQRLLRTAVRVLEPVAPSVTGRWATRLWFTVPPPSRRPARDPRTSGTRFDLAVHDRTVRGTRWGDQDGPIVLLVHGWGGSARQMFPFVDPLVAEGWHVVAYDGPSHGRSDAGALGPQRATVPELADALLAVARTLAEPPSAVVAHSLGSLVVGAALTAGLETERLVLVAPASEATSFSHGFVAALGGGERTRLRLLRGIEAQIGRPVAEFDLVPSPAPHVPLLVVHDRDDRETPFAGAERIVAAWPDAQLHATEGLGHRRLLADPAVVERVVGFVTAPAPAHQSWRPRILSGRPSGS